MLKLWCGLVDCYVKYLNVQYFNSPEKKRRKWRTRTVQHVIGGSPEIAKLHQGSQFPPWSSHWSERWWSDTSPENYPNTSASHLDGSQTCADNTNPSSKEIIDKCLNSAIYWSGSKSDSVLQ